MVRTLDTFSKLTDNLQKDIDNCEANRLSGPFDAFRNLETLEESHCKNITGWSKDEFVNFLRHIKNIRNTKHRTKAQLIALYKYWLRKGIDQQSLSYFKKNSSQRQISRELEQARIAVYNQFTLLNLGFKHISRDFLIGQNTPSVNELYQIDKNTLVLIFDGGYERCEKSVNNEFQSNTFSGQKKQNLIKPFLIVSPNGYICDVYCDHEAWMNDEQILRYTLRTDRYLRNVLKPNDLMFVDRGFRDIVEDLETEYKLRVIIPHCQQLEQKERKKEDTITKKSKKKDDTLTCEQSSQARMCTKIRSMVERIFSIIKQNYSLDYVRNTVLGHLGIDLRNCCSFFNYTFKPVLYDQPHSIDVARRLRLTAENNNMNHLAFLLNLRLTTTSNFKRISLTEIEDFVKCKGKYLRRKIFLGSFQYRMAKKSYITDLMKRSKFYTLNPVKKLLKQFDNKTKIIGVKMPSRFHRGKNKKKRDEEEIDQFVSFNKVFLQYTPVEFGVSTKRIGNKKNKINGYICSCKNGKRRAGCCSHVACVIYYLSCARFKKIIRFPADYLNKILKKKYKNRPS